MTNQSSFPLLAVVAAAIAVTAGCGGAEPVSPQLWAASHCEALTTYREEILALSNDTGIDDRLVEDLNAAQDFFEGILNINDQLSEQIAWIGPPDVAGGVEWQEAYVNDLRESHETQKVVLTEMLDDLRDLPRSSEVSAAEADLDDRLNESGAALGEELQVTLNAMPSSLQAAHPNECQSLFR